MGVRLKQIPNKNAETTGSVGPEWVEDSPDKRETTVDGQTFHWGPNQSRNFMDDGIGLNHAAFYGNVTIQNPTQVDTIPFGDSRS